MPFNNDTLSDECVAKLLAEDARKSSIKYSSMGLTALLPKRATNSAPKPNTRFLQSILRETDSHNAALKKKEEVEARLRLQNIRNGEVRDVQARSRQSQKRRRDFDDRESDLRDHKRRSRISHEEDDRRSKERDRHRYSQSRRSGRNDISSSDEHEAGNNRHRVSRRRDRERKNRFPVSDQSRRRKRNQDSVSDSSSSCHHRSRRHKRERRSDHPRHHRRKASRSRSRSRDPNPPEPDRQKTGPTSPPLNQRRKTSPSPSPTSSSSTTSSDPLESIVGPLPPPTSKTPQAHLISRGRNSYRASTTSKIDTHFSPTYDPSLDIPPHSAPSSPSSPSNSNHNNKREKSKDQDDWDLALEALRDREIWKKKGADRLREAGFGEGEVRRWEEAQSAVGLREREKGPEDVRWNGKGEQREWDAGKVVLDVGTADGVETGFRGAGGRGKRDLKGEIGLEAAWKRKGSGKGGGLLGEMRRALR